MVSTGGNDFCELRRIILLFIVIYIHIYYKSRHTYIYILNLDIEITFMNGHHLESQFVCMFCHVQSRVSVRNLSNIISLG